MINHPGVPVPSRPFRLHRPLTCSATVSCFRFCLSVAPSEALFLQVCPAVRSSQCHLGREAPPTTTEGTKAAPAPRLSPTALLSPLQTARGDALCSGVYLGPDSSPTRTETSSGESVWCLLAPADVGRPGGVDGKAGRTCALPVSGTVCQVLDVTDGGDNRVHRGSGLQEKAVGAPPPTPTPLVGIGRSPRAKRPVAVSSGSWGRQGRSA